jgi:MFS family permease
VLLVTALWSATTSVDATAVGITLPAIRRDFGASLTALQWVVTSYTLALADLLLFAGTLGDRDGRKRLPRRRRIVRMASLLCGARTSTYAPPQAGKGRTPEGPRRVC